MLGFFCSSWSCDQSLGVSAVPPESDLPRSALQAGEGVWHYRLRQFLAVPQAHPSAFSLLTASPPAAGVAMAYQMWPEGFRGKRQLREERISGKELSTISDAREIK